MANRENPVTWLLGNRELLALVFVAVAWLAQKMGLTKKREEAAKRAAAQEAASADTTASLSDDEAERTRRVQEEVRRKIAERRAGGAPAQSPIRSLREPPPPVVAPRPIAQHPLSPSRGGGWAEMLKPYYEAPNPKPQKADEDELGAVLARQRDLEERMRQLQSSSAAVSRSAGGSRAPAGSYLGQFSMAEAAEEASIPSVQLGANFAWISQLRDPSTARRAMVLREVLGPPVAFR
jgi:hypothetical protein